MDNPALALHCRLTGALFGAFIADALAMPVHWYYDTAALARDYGWVTNFTQPRNPHPDSILWRSKYHPLRPEADILHNQATFWGQRGIHYHQFLEAGENTLNLKISQLLMDSLLEKDAYDQELYLEKYVAFMTTPGTHKDTYVEECHREFFKVRVSPKKGPAAHLPDEKHIGGLCLPLPLLLFYQGQWDEALQQAEQHLALTHPGPLMRNALTCFADILRDILDGSDVRQSLNKNRPKPLQGFCGYPFAALSRRADTDVARNVFSTACYIQQSLPLTLYLAWKYQDDPEQALVVNTNLGGDNCHRGVVLGALLGALHGEQAWPRRWMDGLTHPPSAFSQRLATRFKADA
jgi:ADP-ribosylglycohydrolase